MNTTITFQRPAIESTAATSQPLLRRIVDALRERMRRYALDPRTRYLSNACDHVDFESRMRAWEAYEHRAATFGRMF
jgi:hypothetical protein